MTTGLNGWLRSLRKPAGWRGVRRISVVAMVGLLGVVGVGPVASAEPDPGERLTSSEFGELRQTLERMGWRCYDALDVPHPRKSCLLDDAGAHGSIEAQFGPTGDVGRIQIYFSDEITDEPIARRTAQAAADILLDGRGDDVVNVTTGSGDLRIGSVQIRDEGPSTFLVTDRYQAAGKPSAEQPWFPSERLVRRNLHALDFTCHVPEHDDLACVRDRWGIKYTVTKVGDEKWVASYTAPDKHRIPAAQAMRYTGEVLHYAGLAGTEAQRLINSAVTTTMEEQPLTGRERFRGFAGGYDYTMDNAGTDEFDPDTTGPETVGSITVEPYFGTGYR